MTGPAIQRKPVPKSYLPPAPRETAHTTDVLVSLSVALALGITAVAIALWPAEQSPKTAAQAVMPTVAAAAHAEAPTHAEPATVENVPTRFANPFDASEVFEFPPGTTQDAARESVAETLLQRARDRRIQIGSVKVRDHRSAALRARALISEQF